MNILIIKGIVFILGDWGLGIGDWVLVIRNLQLGLIINPQSPIPNKL